MRRAQVRRVSLALAMATLGGCATLHRPATSVPALLASGDSVSRANLTVRDSVVARLVQRAIRRADGTLDILLLSGGGQHGAWGVGFLRGWRARENDAMPTFDMVSGISTGALQAPFALLGTPAALDTLAGLYRRAADRIAPTFDWWFWLRRTGGLVNTARYERTLRHTIDTTMRNALRTEFAAGRQLLTATTDMDLGIGRLWDLSAELGRSDASLARTHTLLYAATAIPGIFPPRVIDGHVHSDGGVVSNVLPVLELEDFRTLARALRVAGVDAPVRVRLWVVMNVWTHAAPRVVPASNRSRISARSTELLFWAAQPLALQRLEELARAVTADVSGLQLDVHITMPPAALATEPGADRLFDAAWMAQLEQLGESKARSASPWDRLWSSYVRPPSR
jgi:predicted acylesterase/phospholipase RssA